MKPFFITFIYLCIILSSCQAQTSKNIQLLEAPAFAEKIKNTPNAQILDVRTAQEFAGEHLDNSKNINWLNADFVTNVATLDKTKPVFVYCKAGSRSQKAAEKLAEMGFTTVYDLQGGILKWEAAGLSKPSEKLVGINKQQFEALLASDKKVLINFFAPWCAPCKKMEPYILKMQKEMKDKVVIVRLNADENKTIMKELKIEELPSMLLYENKNLKWKSSGYVSEDDLKKQLL
nr:thioredoxin domain-containing protein [uncultured Flavobacterium sp.]